MRQLQQERLENHTTFRIGGPAAYYLIPETPEEVEQARDFARERELPWFVLGKGSNVLFSDRGYRGVVIEIGSSLDRIERTQGNVVTASAGVALSKFAAVLAEYGLAGFAFAGGIPGTLGGAITMNAGAYGGEIHDRILSARVLTDSGEIRELDREELELGYRTSVIQKKNYIVLSGAFSFEEGKREDILSEMRELNQRRREKQPLEYPSAGSTFKRPPGHFAGKLIEEAGLRGYRVGDAQVSEKHCGFVVNRGHATAAEVVQLMEEVKRRVRETSGVELEPEVKLVGEF